jgi:hypothetical protein
MGKIIKKDFDFRKVTLTESYKHAVRELLTAQILMMRKVPGNSPEFWVIGCAKIKDLNDSCGLQLTFSGIEEKNG